LRRSNQLRQSRLSRHSILSHQYRQWHPCHLSHLLSQLRL
jgi:hypothetical protein